jgi:hypothetical protein
VLQELKEIVYSQHFELQQLHSIQQQQNMESTEKERLEDVDLDTPEVDRNGKVVETMRCEIASPLTLYSHYQLFKFPGGSTADAQVKENPTVPKASDGGVCSKWTKMVHRIHQPILKALLYITSIAASNPKRTIVAVIALSSLLVVVGLLTNFEVVADDDNAWTPADSRPVKHEDWIDDESGFPESNRYFHMIFHSEGENVLSQGNVKRVFQAFDTVRGLEDYDAVCNASIYRDKFGDPACPVEGVTSYWNNSAAIFASEVQSNDEAIIAMSAEKYPDDEPVAEKDIMGFPKRYVNGTLQSAQSYILKIEFPDNDSQKSLRIRPWMRSLTWTTIGSNCLCRDGHLYQPVFLEKGQGPVQESTGVWRCGDSLAEYH